MPIDNTFDVEDLIIAKLDSLFELDMILSEDLAQDIDVNFFNTIEKVEERVGCIVMDAGYRADPLVGDKRAPKQRLKMLWQIVIICPKDLRKTVGGLKRMEVMQKLKGYRLSEEIGIMQLIDDERGFNRPEYAGDMAYLPIMFTVDTVI